MLFRSGECFVFDHRVALDQNLQPSTKYGLCPHCGQPSEIKIDCVRCDSEELICVDCAKLEFKKDTCSKNCAHQTKIHPGKKGPKQIVPFEVEKMKAEGVADEELPVIQVTKTKRVEVDKKGHSVTVTVTPEREHSTSKESSASSDASTTLAAKRSRWRLPSGQPAHPSSTASSSAPGPQQ